MAISLALALLGWRLAYRYYIQDPRKPEELAQRWQTYHTLLVNKYYVDEGYAKAIISPIYNLAVGLWRIFDVQVIDGIVNGIAKFISLDGEVVKHVQTGYVRTYALWMAVGALCILWFIV